MPTEKLFVSISEPDGIFPSVARSNCLMSQAPSGPTIIAPRNMGTLDPMMMPAVTIAPTTPPRCP